MEKEVNIYKHCLENEISKKLLKTIKLYCKSDCCFNHEDNWLNCPNEKCRLWRFREGKMPISASKNKKVCQTLRKEKSSEFSREKRGVTGTGGQI